MLGQISKWMLLALFSLIDFSVLVKGLFLLKSSFTGTLKGKEFDLRDNSGRLGLIESSFIRDSSR
jgi:hypothetical protein